MPRVAPRQRAMTDGRSSFGKTPLRSIPQLGSWGITSSCSSSQPHLTISSKSTTSGSRRTSAFSFVRSSTTSKKRIHDELVLLRQFHCREVYGQVSIHATRSRSLFGPPKQLKVFALLLSDHFVLNNKHHCFFLIDQHQMSDVIAERPCDRWKCLTGNDTSLSKRKPL